MASDAGMGPVKLLFLSETTSSDASLSPELGWDAPAKLVVAQSHLGHADAGAQVHRERAGEGVVAQVEPLQAA